jgi:hypothetical protein
MVATRSTHRVPLFDELQPLDRRFEPGALLAGIARPTGAARTPRS